MHRFIKIVEVGPRDGLQGALALSSSVRTEYAKKLVDAGAKNIEIGSFVSKKVKAMRDSDIVLKTIKGYNPQANYIALVANERYAMEAIIAGATELAVFTTVSETFANKNTNCTIDQNFLTIKKIVDVAKMYNIPVRGYISCVMGCPYEGYTDHYPDLVAISAAKLADIGCYEISLGDTIGIGDPRQTRSVLKAVQRYLPLSQTAVHFHNTYGRALANICVALDEGVTTIDSASGGLGGCPYAKGATGNIATEDVVDMLDRMGFNTGFDLLKLHAATKYICEQLEQQPVAHISAVYNAKLALEQTDC